MGPCKRGCGLVLRQFGDFCVGKTVLETPGLRFLPAYLDRAAQEVVVDALRGVLAAAPLVQPVTPGGKPMSVRMTAAGRFGWISDRAGYRYSETHPHGMAWPSIPAPLLDLWRAVADHPRAPECCLINWYDAAARMGLHQDRDEADFTAPVVSLSLGDAARFRVGATTRGGPTRSVWLNSGDVVVLGGEARLAYHGIDKIRHGSSTLLPKGGRINVTMRVVTAAPDQEGA